MIGWWRVMQRAAAVVQQTRQSYLLAQMVQVLRNSTAAARLRQAALQQSVVWALRPLALNRWQVLPGKLPPAAQMTAVLSAGVHLLCLASPRLA
jgi:hypothetical protein